MMPAWLQAISRADPLTDEVDALRAMMLHAGTTSYDLGLDFAVLVGATAVLMWIGARLYPRVVI